MIKKTIALILLFCFPFFLFAGIDFTSERIDLSTPITATDSYTMSFWFNSDGNSTTTIMIEGQVSSSPSFEGTDSGFTFFVNNISGISTGSINTGQWFHVALVWNESTGIFELFLDNVSKGTASTTTDDAITTLNIGSRRTDALPFDGKITEYGLWDIVLTDAEITLLAKSHVKGMSYQIQPGNLQVYLPMDDFADGATVTGANSVKDRSGNGNHASPQGGNPNGFAEQVLSYP